MNYIKVKFVKLTEKNINAQSMSLHLVLKCALGDRITRGQLRYVAMYTRVHTAYLRCPADHLSSEFVPAGVTSARAEVSSLIRKGPV